MFAIDGQYPIKTRTSPDLKIKKTYYLFIIVMGIGLMAPSMVSSQNIVPTFHSLGIYWKPASSVAVMDSCAIYYKNVESTTWKKALDLWYDKRNNEFRGSIVHLTPNTEYQVRLIPKGNNDTISTTAKTWDEQIPISDTVFLPRYSEETFKVNRSGKEGAYVLYTHIPGDSALIDIKRKAPLCIQVEQGTSHVVIRGIKMRGATDHGIRLLNNVHDVVIENNDISNWGSEHEDGWGVNRNSAIFSARKDSSISKIIIQRNKIHHPFSTSNTWDDTRMNGSNHPEGPQGIHLAETGGNLVIRYNEIYSDSSHYFNDAIGAAENFSFRGFPNCDSDIYGNKISHCWDDGIESEGANRNVRIWGNFIDKTYVKIAIAATSIGPLYIFRNIGGSSRKSPNASLTAPDSRGPFIKAGGLITNDTFYGGGKTYVFHNTVYQPINDSTDFPLGSSGSIQSSGGFLYNVVSRNNIFLSFNPRISSFQIRADSCTNDFDHDLYNGKFQGICPIGHHQKNGVFIRQSDYQIFDTANVQVPYALMGSSPAVDTGEIIPNFNDGYSNEAPDLGAIEFGGKTLDIGVDAKTGTSQPLFRRTILYLLLLLATIIAGVIVFLKSNTKNQDSNFNESRTK